MVSTINFITSDRTQWTPHFFSEGSWETTLPWQDENFIFECFEQQKETYLHQERDKNFIRNNNTLEKASCKILAPVSFGEKQINSLIKRVGKNFIRDAIHQTTCNPLTSSEMGCKVITKNYHEIYVTLWWLWWYVISVLHIINDYCL